MPGQRSPVPQRRFGVRPILAVVALLLAGFGAWILWPFWRLSASFADHRFLQPSRLYGRPLDLAVGDSVSRRRTLDELDLLGYRRAVGDEIRAGELALPDAAHLTVQLRSFPTPEGIRPGGRLEITWSQGRVARLTVGGREVEKASLEPPVVASYFGPERQERRPVGIDELPEDLVHAVLAAEDSGFFHHAGLSVSGILRAAWVDLRGGSIRQGGSTLTQQLVKNLYLTQERTVVRKVREAILALLVDARYSKRAILDAYLNEIYWGASNGVNLMGVGAAARAYFGCDADELTLPESAVLAGMIRSPAEYSPIEHPEAARRRRDWVLARMAELGWLDHSRLERATAAPVSVSPQPVVVRRAAYFADFAAAEAARRFGVTELAGTGYALLSTLDLGDEREAQGAVAWGLAALEKGWEKGHGGHGPLQGALVSVDPRNGEILAYVGGRDYARSQFDRAAQALRQAGSAFKPVVYATAFADGTISPSTELDDAPLTVTVSGGTWTPQNDDGTFRGWVTTTTALQKSLNVPTARLALQIGLPRIVEVAERMGITTPLEPVPALALGAFEVTPLDLTTVYSTLAADGLRPDLHGLTALLDPAGRPVDGSAPTVPERAISRQVAAMITSILQGVFDRGTAARARSYGIEGPLAGKTGTSNGRRDSWFAGYSPERATVVWVGYDDDAETRLSGSRAGLPIWSRFVLRVRPPGGYSDFQLPPGVVTVVIDPESGELASEECPETITEVFLPHQVPDTVCHLHGGWFTRPATQPEGVEVGRGHPFRRWLERVFGRRRPAPPPP